MAQYTILISVDPYTRAFNYTDLVRGGDASRIAITNGDTIVWVLDSALSERTFQMDFYTLNPFRRGKAISFRGSDFVVAPVAQLPPNFSKSLNRAFKYSVSLGNGWRDATSPYLNVVPDPPGGGGGPLFPGGANPSATENINWTDATETALVLNPGDLNPTVADPTKTAYVTWQWDPNQQDTPPFTLTFAYAGATPPGWPSPGTPITEEFISLPLGPGSGTFSITTAEPGTAPIVLTTPVAATLTVTSLT